jgi:hypothetical protein
VNQLRGDKVGSTTPNISIFVPFSGEDLYRASYSSGQTRIDSHQHTGAPTGGLPLITGSYSDHSVTPDKLSNQVRQAANYISNLGMSYSGGVFAVTSSDGSSLSSTNKAYVTFQNNTNPGQLITLTAIANQSFDDAASGTSQIAGNLFGRASGVDSTADVQFYLYAVMNDAHTAIQMMICPLPCQDVAPASTEIGMPSNPIANTPGSFFSLGNITVADYDGNPAVELGCFRMRKTGGAANDWTVQGLTTGDGIGACNCGDGAEIDGPGFPKSPGWQNLAFVYASGFFQVTDATGEPLSITNKASVTLSSNVTPSTLVTVDISQGLGFFDSTSLSGSDIAGNLFGTQDDNTAPGGPRGWINDMPWFLYAVLNDAEDGIGFAVSRSPCANVAPATGDEGTIGLATAITQNAFYYLARDSSGNSIIPTATPGGTAADYVALFNGNPCICIGAFRTRKVVSTANDWTVNALSFLIGDGIGKYHENTIFTLPPGVNGAVISTFLKPPANPAQTVPTFTTAQSYYSIDRNGQVYHKMSLFNCSGTGTGVSALQFILPYAIVGTPRLFFGSGIYISTGMPVGLNPTQIIVSPNTAFVNSIVENTAVINYNTVALTETIESDVLLKCF